MSDMRRNNLRYSGQDDVSVLHDAAVSVARTVDCDGDYPGNTNCLIEPVVVAERQP